MQRKNLAWLLIVGLAYDAESGRHACAGGAIQGKVTQMNLMQPPPKIPIPGARVQVKLLDTGELHPKDPVTTDRDGKFHIKNVPNGACQLKVDVVDLPLYYSDKFTVKDNDQMLDLPPLIPNLSGQADKEETNLAVAFVNLAPEIGAKRTAYYSTEWKGFVNLNVPPSSRARLAIALEKEDKSASANHADLKAYAKETPDEIRAVEALFAQALQGKKDLPGKNKLGELKVGGDVIADVMLYQVRQTPLSDEMRSALCSEFLTKWEGTPVAARFKGYQQQGLVTLPPTITIRPTNQAKQR
jgi:hypothetical protein